MTPLPNQGTFPPDPKPEPSLTGDSSGLPPSEIYGASLRIAAVATGSLPVSSAEFIQAAGVLERYAAELERRGVTWLPWHYRELSAELRTEAEYVRSRQPEENAPVSHAPSAKS
jgi:hypothetical protein